MAFYMSAVPRLGERGQDFRTLPPEHSRSDDAMVDALIRDVRARQSSSAILEATTRTSMSKSSEASRWLTQSRLS